MLLSALGCRAIAKDLVWEGLDLSLGLWGALCVCRPGAQGPKSLSAVNAKIVSPHLPSPASAFLPLTIALNLQPLARKPGSSWTLQGLVLPEFAAPSSF